VAVTVRVDRDRCRGLGLCVGMDPDRFQLTADGRSVATTTYVSDPRLVALVRDVAHCCPMEAVEVRPAGEPDRHPEAGP
jgi:ferredoxin